MRRKWALIALGAVMLVAVSAVPILREVSEVLHRPPFPTVSPAPGMRAESFGNVGFAVPLEWKRAMSGEITGPIEWEAGGRTRMSLRFGTMLECPDLAEHSDDSIDVPGAGGATRRVDGTPLGTATVVHTWTPSCEDSITLTIWDDPATVGRIVASLVVEA